MVDMRALLAEFGAEPTAVRLLDDETPELLPYATLMTARRNADDELGVVEAVYEWQDAPLAFLIQEESLASDSELQRIRGLLAMRGDAPYLGVVAPGSLRVYGIALDRKPLRQARVDQWGDDAGTRNTVLTGLANGRPQAGINNRTWISDIVLRLLDASMTRIIGLEASHEDAISLVGRALFTRFLGDRGLLPEHMSEPETSATLFDTPDAAEKTSEWLDDTFNGDLLPLSADIFGRLPAEGYLALGDVLRRAPDGQLMLGWQEKWGHLDFAHIPVGVLSQAYEHYQRKHAPTRQRREGGYFTPRPIAEILKVLFRGTKADLGVLQRMRAKDYPTLEAFWKARFGTYGGHLRGSGNGYQKFRTTSSVSRREGDGRRGVDASYLHGRAQIAAGPFARMLIDSSLLDLFAEERIHRRRSVELFAGPQVIVHQSPAKSTARISVAVSDEGVVYNESFHGYCPGRDADAGLLVRYLALVLGSKLTMWFALVTSGRFGVERDVVEKIILDRLPLPPFDGLGPDHRDEVRRLVAALDSGAASWEEVDAWVARLYGLGERDLQVVSDTLEFNLPFAENKRRAQAVPLGDERERFCEALRDELLPWCERFGSRVVVYPVRSPAPSPWYAIAVRAGRAGAEGTVTGDDWAGLLRAADAAAATEILVEDGSDGLLIGRLAQRRYWSTTQARLLARRIAWSHVELLKRRADE